MPQTLPNPAALQVKGACAFLNISKPSLYRLVDRGLLKPNRSLRHLLFPIAELERFLRDGQFE
jgi:excisionase family DNA binding protein